MTPVGRLLFHACKVKTISCRETRPACPKTCPVLFCPVHPYIHHITCNIQTPQPPSSRSWNVNNQAHFLPAEPADHPQAPYKSIRTSTLRSNSPNKGSTMTHKGRRGGARGGGSASTVMGRLLLTRLEEYGQTADLRDVDSAVSYLCQNFPEYRRQKQGPLARWVAKTAEGIVRQQEKAQESARTQELEDRYLAAKRGKRQKSRVDVSDDSLSEWSGIERGEPKPERVRQTDTESDSEIKSEEQMDDVMEFERSEKMNSRLRQLYGIEEEGNRNKRQNGSAKRDCEGSDDADSKQTSTGPPRLSEKVPEGHRSQGALSRGADDDNTKQRTAKKSQKTRKRDTETTPLKTDKPDRKKVKKPGTSARHATLSKTAMTVPKPIRYDDLGGLEDVLNDIREVIEYPLKHPEVYAWLGVEPPRGVLLHGPPGCGKTALAHAIANECGVPFFRISAPEIVSGMSGESEAKIRALFKDAIDAAPAILFIDEIDAIAQKRENAQREMERRIVAQMLTCMDDLSGQDTIVEQPDLVGDADGPGNTTIDQTNTEQQKTVNKQGGNVGMRHVVVIGATNRPDALDAALRRAGRFDREISLGIPNESARVKILSVMCKKLRLEGDFDFTTVARKTPGFVGADLEALTKEAAALAVTRIFRSIESKTTQKDNTQEKVEDVSMADVNGLDQKEVGCSSDIQLQGTRLGGSALTQEELEGLAITMLDFESAIPKVQPSVRREGFTTKPDVTWADVGSLEEVREELSFAVTKPIRHPEYFEALGMSLASGVLLYGPPGCGKTLVAKAVANEAGANFMSIKGPELLNKYVGESERAVRQLFSRARAAHPCVLFFDEMDALAPKRGSDNQAAERVVNQLLTEMDGMDSREGVYLIAATNRPDIIDPALLRPGRLDKMLYIPLPDANARVGILNALVRKTPLATDVDTVKIARDARCTGFSGADMAALLREACVVALKSSLASSGNDFGSKERVQVTSEHFGKALDCIRPSVSAADHRSYEQLKLTLRRSRAHIKNEDQPSGGGQ